MSKDASTSPQICILLAHQRSGTHFLRSMMGNAAGVAALGEICNPDRANQRAGFSFLTFRADASMADQRFFYPTTEVQTELLDNYMAFLCRAFAPARHVILDVKYSHIYVFQPCWWSIISRPFFLHYAIERGIKFIHLVREKPYHTAISNLYALNSKKWQVRSGEELPSAKITVDRAALQDRAVNIAKSVSLCSEWLIGADQIRMSYEALVCQPAETLRNLRDFLGLKVDIPPRSEFIRMTPRYEEAIANFGEIADLLDLDLTTVLDRTPTLQPLT